MNCFVIMPFANEFDDVYAAIKRGVEQVLSSRGGMCFRIDDVRPAGRITDRLLREIEAADLCIADLTGAKPNVMWEAGYAMALGKPCIMLAQDVTAIPFDVRDMQTLHYSRNHLSQTLTRPLERILIDTIQARMTQVKGVRPVASTSDNELVGALLAQVEELKRMIGEAVRSWSPPRPELAVSAVARDRLAALEGAWINRESGSHFYARIVNDELIVPYCYAGNGQMAGLYFAFRQTGQYWFGRFAWLKDTISGFAFLKQDSADSMTGAWWIDDDAIGDPDTPPPFGSGVPARWERVSDGKFPAWASEFIEEVREHGLPGRFARRGSPP